MSETNKTYRIKTNVDASMNDGYITIDANLTQDYDAFDILSIKLDSVDAYKLHNSNYGVVVGRVLANNGFGVPNAKLSIFIESDSDDGDKIRTLYPFTHTYSKDEEGVRYNLLPDEHVGDCHQIVGTFPNKRYMLDDDLSLEVFDKYYKFTTRTNNSGDYLIKGVPVGSHTLHMDLDLSDCGILSQRPRDFVYKGYTIEQFENPNMFKSGTTYENLSQIFTQNQVINVKPFWGNDSLGETLGITRADINVSFTFQPTCVFMGSVASDNSSQGITKKCIATENMGNMEEMVTGEGTIEMIRKTPGGDIEEFQVKGTQLINANGVWCYQIPMNLDYMMTDEYGNMVPTDDPNKGIPTRTSVRFRISMQDNEENVDNFFRVKVLVPHNPQNLSDGGHEDYDYEFGSKTRDDSFRDLFWNNVYSVKSYIPRFQKRKVMGWKEKKFTGIKNCNFFGQNNPIPYNNIRIKLPLMFTILCALIKCLVGAVTLINTVIAYIGRILADVGDFSFGIEIRKKNLPNFWPFTEVDDGFNWTIVKTSWPLFKVFTWAQKLKLITISEGLCPDLENWFFTPINKSIKNTERKELFKTYEAGKDKEKYNILEQTFDSLQNKDERIFDDLQSIDMKNADTKDDVYCITTKIDYLIHCIEMNLAMEHKVINFDFYNDWINGLIYVPRFMRFSRTKKVLFNGKGKIKVKIKGCMDDTSIFNNTRRIVQQCALPYNVRQIGQVSNIYNVYSSVLKNNSTKYHKKEGFKHKSIFGKNGGVCHEHTTSKKQHVYYMKPCEWLPESTPKDIKVNLFSTDIILLGSLNSCDSNGLPQAFKYLSSTSYIMPPNLALTNMETNGHLYANTKGTICKGNQKQEPFANSSVTASDRGVSIVTPQSGLSGELKYLSNTNDDDIEINYEKNELSDLIAITEVAGVSWNYTGPGQGEPDKDNLYNPGGHFLGLTCNNSETNIKSCINLERICEVGSNMSQRKEEIVNVSDGYKIEYINHAPTGFISGNDLVDVDFRSMFATMNKNRLIANDINPITGYKTYSLDFMRPINFDGAFRDIIKNSAQYNNKEDLNPKESVDILQTARIDIGSRLDGSGLNDKVKTVTMTVEDTNVDYYLFRLGLTYENLKQDDFHKRKFVINDNNNYFLPQYENSYYFYFGMRNGATAIDEFNAQYFSECEKTQLIDNTPKIEVEINEESIYCVGATVDIFITGLEMPYQKIYYIKDNNEKIIDNKNLSEEKYTVKGLTDFGTYIFYVIDNNGLSLSKTIEIGKDLFSANIEIYPFNALGVSKSKTLSTSNILGDDVSTNIEEGESHVMGYVKPCTDYVCKESYLESGWTCNTDNTCKGDIIFCRDDNTCSRDLGDYIPCPTFNICRAFSHCPAVSISPPNDEEENEISMENSAFRGGYLSISKCSMKNSSDVEEWGISIKDSSSEDYGVVVYSADTSINTNVDDTAIIYYVDEYDKTYEVYFYYKCDESSDKKYQLYDTYYFSEPNSLKLNMGYEEENTYLTVGTNGLDFDSTNWWNNINYSANDALIEYRNWIKRASVIKRTSSANTFSNNVFVSGGTKVLWGVPQNSTKGLFKKDDDYKVFNSLESTSNYNGYTLDDDFSYVGTTNSFNYSAIAVSGNDVSGIAYVVLSGGSIVEVDENSVISSLFNSGSGYVFKPIGLQNANLQYHIFNGKYLEYDKYLLPDGSYSNSLPGNEIKDGLFYPSFTYPVIERPFKVELETYIWNSLEPTPFFNEDTKYDFNITTTNVGGRSEVRIVNGLTYQGRFNEFMVPYLQNDIINANISLSGDTDGRDYSTLNKLIAPYDSPVSNLEYRISEGYPTTNPLLKNVVNSYENNVNVNNVFSNSLFYDVLYHLPDGSRIVKFNDIDNVDLWVFKNSSEDFVSSLSGKTNLFRYATSGDERFIYQTIKSGDSDGYCLLCGYISGTTGHNRYELTTLQIYSQTENTDSGFKYIYSFIYDGRDYRHNSDNPLSLTDLYNIAVEKAPEFNDKFVPLLNASVSSHFNDIKFNINKAGNLKLIERDELNGYYILNKVTTEQYNGEISYPIFGVQTYNVEDSEHFDIKIKKLFPVILPNPIISNKAPISIYVEKEVNIESFDWSRDTLTSDNNKFYVKFDRSASDDNYLNLSINNGESYFISPSIKKDELFMIYNAYDEIIYLQLSGAVTSNCTNAVSSYTFTFKVIDESHGFGRHILEFSNNTGKRGVVLYQNNRFSSGDTFNISWKYGDSSGTVPCNYPSNVYDYHLLTLKIKKIGNSLEPSLYNGTDSITYNKIVVGQAFTTARYKVKTNNRELETTTNGTLEFSWTVADKIETINITLEE